MTLVRYNMCLTQFKYFIFICQWTCTHLTKRQFHDEIAHEWEIHCVLYIMNDCILKMDKLRFPICYAHSTTQYLDSRVNLKSLQWPWVQAVYSRHFRAHQMYNSIRSRTELTFPALRGEVSVSLAVTICRWYSQCLNFSLLTPSRSAATSSPGSLSATLLPSLACVCVSVCMTMSPMWRMADRTE